MTPRDLLEAITADCVQHTTEPVPTVARRRLESTADAVSSCASRLAIRDAEEERAATHRAVLLMAGRPVAIVASASVRGRTFR